MGVVPSGHRVIPRRLGRQGLCVVPSRRVSRHSAGMGIKELSLELAAVSLIADEAKKAKDRLRAALQAEMDAIGADRVKAEYGDDVIAYVTTTKPKFKWVIKSDKRFIDWVRANIPSEIVESVRESSIDAILDKFNYLDDMVIDPNGEVVDWLPPCPACNSFVEGFRIIKEDSK